MEPFVLIEGEDYTLEDGEGPVLWNPGISAWATRMPLAVTS